MPAQRRVRERRHRRLALELVAPPACAGWFHAGIGPQRRRVQVVQAGAAQLADIGAQARDDCLVSAKRVAQRKEVGSTRS
jgi:hypothetical protein